MVACIAAVEGIFTEISFAMEGKQPHERAQSVAIIEDHLGSEGPSPPIFVVKFALNSQSSTS